ncbi:MAG: hypothetical protein ACTS2F_05410 [Thainema sp.]
MQLSRLRFSIPGMNAVQAISSFLSAFKHGRLTRLFGVSVLAIVLWFGAASAYLQPAQAAMTPEAKAYENGPVRQTHNPISKENYNGGVDPSVVYEHQNQQARQMEEDRTPLERITDQIKETFSGTSSSDVNPEKNPTLRYTDEQQ